MARLRTLKPSFFTNEDLGEVHPLGRILFAGLWTEADRAGRLEDRPRRLKAALLPYDDADVDELLDALASRGFILRYEVDGARYIAVLSFGKHQRPHSKESASVIPAPNGEPPAPTQVVASTDLGNGEHARSSVFRLLSLGSGDLKPSGGRAARAGPKAGHVKREARVTPKVTEVASIIKAADVDVTITPRDGKAIKDCSAPAQQIADAYVAAFRGEWGGEWLRSNLSLHVVVDRLAGFAARANGHANGKTALPVFDYLDKRGA